MGDCIIIRPKPLLGENVSDAVYVAMDGQVGFDVDEKGRSAAARLLAGVQFIDGMATRPYDGSSFDLFVKKHRRAGAWKTPIFAEAPCFGESLKPDAIRNDTLPEEDVGAESIALLLSGQPGRFVIWWVFPWSAVLVGDFTEELQEIQAMNIPVEHVEDGSPLPEW